MYSYSIWQWIILFFTYSFFGWIWEIVYLSIKNMRPIFDKGVLSGPLRTMYGAGALILLIFAGPVKNSLILSYLAGMAGATLLELIVGIIFEKTFKRKCWDYSEMKMNIGGHICLPASLLWGLFTVFFIRYIHPFIHSYVIMIPDGIGKGIAVIMIILFAVDVYQSISKMVYAG